MNAVRLLSSRRGVARAAWPLPHHLVWCGEVYLTSPYLVQVNRRLASLSYKRKEEALKAAQQLRGEDGALRTPPAPHASTRSHLRSRTRCGKASCRC